MKVFFITCIVLSVILWTVFVNVGVASPIPIVDEEELKQHEVVESVQVSPEVYDACVAKGDVTLFTYKNRDKKTEKEMLKEVEYDYIHFWKPKQNVSHATYVDMQRIVRDAYRKQDGEYIRQNIPRYYALLEIETCFFDLQY